MPLKRAFATTLVLPLMIVACTVEPTLEPEKLKQTEEELTGGRQALESEYPSTVHFGGCTGAKVGPRHFLIAAHCVHDAYGNQVSGGYQPGFNVGVSTDNLASGSSYRSLTIEGTYIFPDWLSTCVTPCTVNVLNPSHPPDIAVIVVTEETPDIAAASIDESPVALGDRVVLTGYGCEDGLNQPSSNGPRFKLQEVPAEDGNALNHPGSFVTPEDAPNVAASYVITPGLAASSQAASLCFGDSGGPLYRESPNQLLLVGVNAYYTFPDGNGISTTNWHTRTDSQARYPVLSWLQGLGVNIHNGEPQTSTPYGGTARLVTSTIQAEDFDVGGQGLAYSDLDTTNNGGQYRSERVDIESTSDTGLGFNVGWTAPGEWLKYSVIVENSGSYDLELRIASTTAERKLHVEVDGQNVSGSITLPNTGAWQAFQTVTATNIQLSSGAHFLRVVFDTDGSNLNWFRFVPRSVEPEPDPSCTDNIENGTESDVDCGGSCSAKCANGKTCSVSADCSSTLCTSGICQAAASCSDGNGTESDIDCGGSCATKCANGKTCSVSADCSSTLCTSGICQAAASCTDGSKNGTESDVDCGGSCSAKCSDGRSCVAAADCQSATCTNGVCETPTTGDSPCSGLCSNPIVYSSASYNSGSLGSGATCHETSATLSAAICGGVTNGRKLSINGVEVNCSFAIQLPAKRNGGYCVHATAGTESWAWFSTW